MTVGRSTQTRKPSGLIGRTKITATDHGQVAEYIPVELPEGKEDLESWFGERFIKEFNSAEPLGNSIQITSPKKRDTSDLDFTIECPVADYLELVELNPLSEDWGRAAHRTGQLDVHRFAWWIFRRLIKQKMNRYGDTARRTLLVVYSTHWQFFPSDGVIECLRAILTQEGATFPGIFVFRTNDDLNVIQTVVPHSGPIAESPRIFKGRTLTNLRPGNYQWALD
jgi:hypothetical protein